MQCNAWLSFSERKAERLKAGKRVFVCVCVYFYQETKKKISHTHSGGLV